MQKKKLYFSTEVFIGLLHSGLSGGQIVFYCAESCEFQPNFVWYTNYCSESGFYVCLYVLYCSTTTQDFFLMLEFLLFFSSIYVTVKHNILKIVGYIGIIVFVLNVNFRNWKLLKYVLYLLLKAHITKHNGVAQCTEKRMLN